MPKSTNKKYHILKKYTARTILKYEISAKNQKEAEEKFWDKVGYLSYRLVEKIKENLEIKEKK